MNMRKRILALILALTCLALVCLAPGCARHGANFSSGSVTLNVPAGWEPKYNEPSMQLMVAAPGQECVSSVQMLPTDGKSDQQLAEMLSQQLGGSTPEPGDKGGYAFTATSGGVPMVINVAAEGNKAFVYMEVGDKDKFAAELKSIRKSLSSSDAIEQKLIRTVQ